MSHIKIIPSPSFIEVLKELSSTPGAPKSITDYSEKLSSLPEAPKDKINITLTTPDVKWCHQQIRDRGLSYRIHKLLNESELVLPKYEPPPRSPELEARIQKLRAEQANREYRQMTKNLGVDQYEAASLRGLGTDMKEFNAQLREMNRHLVTGVQYLVSIVGTFFAVFIGLGYVLPEYGARVLLSMFSAVLVGVAEIYFIIQQDMVEEKKIQSKNL